MGADPVYAQSLRFEDTLCAARCDRAEPFGLGYNEGRYDNIGGGVCRDGSPCDVANPCLDGGQCFTDGQGFCIDQVTRCKSAEDCKKDRNMDGLRCALPNGDSYQHLLVTHLSGGGGMHPVQVSGDQFGECGFGSGDGVTLEQFVVFGHGVSVSKQPPGVEIRHRFPEFFPVQPC